MRTPENRRGAPKKPDATGTGSAATGTGSTPVTAGEIGENALIARIRKILGDTSAPPPRGIGDDCAVLPVRPNAGTSWMRLATTDCVLRGRHFDDAAPAAAVGEKLVNRNLSDIAAMGGTPADALLALALGAETPLAWLDGFIAGVAAAAREAGVEIAGGDITDAGVPRFFCATLALTGFARHPLPRHGARAGDILLVTGALGGAVASGRHLRIRPRLAEGRWLAQRRAKNAAGTGSTAGSVRACMDISDGLAKDLPAFLPDGASAALFPDSIPINAGSGLRGALTDGEDYELLVAATPDTRDALLAAWHRRFRETPLTVIGEVVSDPLAPGRLLDAATLRPLLPEGAGGFEHFASTAGGAPR
ncbi:MAG: thiamine-phosphate kinase [Puniceicoccales bacterium]|nr:thiamine-phosphate kinase [Puniceicoccales bacterium]